jgi:hypothetical protein
MRSVLTVWRAAGAVFLAVALAGCGSVGNMLGSSSTRAPAPAESGLPPSADTPEQKDALTDMILGKPKPGPAPGDNAFRQDELPCPEVTVRPGASTLQIGKGSPGEVSAMDLRYQGTLVKFSRECRFAPTLVTMKLGIEGRVIVGPAGGPGQIEVPVRFAVVQEGANPKTVLSKLARIPVTIGGDPTVEFTQIDSDVAFPMPRPQSALEQYVVYVGFDPTALAPHKPPPRRKR